MRGAIWLVGVIFAIVAGAAALGVGLATLSSEPFFAMLGGGSAGTEVGMPAGVPGAASSAAPHPPALLVMLDTEAAAGVDLAGTGGPTGTCGISPGLLLAQQWVESRFDPSARSDKGAVGIAQFEPGTFQEYALPVPYGGAMPPTRLDPVDSAWAEARMLCADGASSDPLAALVTYNCGSLSTSCLRASLPYALEVVSLAKDLG